MQLKGKRILITGGGSGIGLAAAGAFLSVGADVIITGRNQDKLDTAKKLYPALTTIKSDVANAADADALLKQVSVLGGIDILYNNAGVLSSPGNLGITSDDHFEKAEYEITINYLGVVRLNNVFMDMLKSRKEAAIINTTSILSYVPLNLAPTYSASKVALRFYTESLRNHLQILKSNVKVFELLPPVVATEMTDGFDVKSITPGHLSQELIKALQKDQFTIRVGTTKSLYMMNRIAPEKAYKILNPEKNSKLLSK